VAQAIAFCGLPLPAEDRRQTPIACPTMRRWIASGLLQAAWRPLAKAALCQGAAFIHSYVSHSWPAITVLSIYYGYIIFVNYKNKGEIDEIRR
jgi:hypothetical protein